ncbi:MAG: imelysin family protein [Devosia sp.]
MRAVLIAALIGLASPALAASALPGNTIITSAIEGYIRPSFEQFVAATGALQSDVDALCKTPSADALNAVQTQFRSTVAAFSRVEFVRIGPLGVGDRLERLLFWPDKKGIALKQVQAALAEKDMSAASPDSLKGKSVAMQGLVALEYLLFGTGSEELGTADGAYRCSYALASTTLIDGLATTIDNEWHDTSPDGPASHMLDPQPTADDYRTETEVLEKLAATLIHGTETIRDQRIMPILSDGKPKPKSALFWRSGMTVPALAGNFAGLHDYFVAAKYPEAMGATNSWVANGAIFEFQNAARAVTDIVDPVDKAVLDPKQLQAFKYLVIITSSLDTLLGTNLAAALGLSVGFSQLDGD